MKSNKIKRNCLCATLALILSSCGGGDPALNHNPYLAGEGEDPTQDSFTLEDTISYKDPYKDMSIRDINADVVECIRQDREEKNRQRQEDKAAFQTNAIRALSSAASIGTALYTKNYSSISPESIQDLSGSVMVMLGFDEGNSMFSFNTKVLNALQNIQKKLDQISEQIADMEINLVDHINNLSKNLQTATNEILNAVADSEVRTRFSNSLTFFQAAKSNWDHFVTSTYVPLQNMCNDFLATYTNYFGEFLDRCYLEKGVFVPVYYSVNGTVTLPRGQIDFDINGQKVAKTKHIFVPLAESAFNKMNTLSGAAYNLIDLDMLQDYLDAGMDKDDAKDVIMQLRLNAAKSYFKDFAAIQSYFNAYLNFGEALTGLTLEGVDASNMSPIDVYHSLLSSVYNFGFETEEEIIALVAKMARVYYSASYINDMARLFSGSNIYEDRFILIEDQIVKGLTTKGIVKPNVGAKFFSYDVDSYVEFEQHELKLEAEFYADEHDEYSDDEWTHDRDNPKYEQTEKGAKVYLDGGEIALSDVGMASISYPDFEMMKIKYIHNILPNLSEPVSFGNYLKIHGLINDPTKNVVFSMDNLYNEDQPQNVKEDPFFNLYLTGEQYNEDCDVEPGVRYSVLDRKELNDTTKVVVSGRVASFDTDIGISGQFVLGVGYIYYDMKGDDYKLDAFSAHPEYHNRNDDMSDFINIHAIDDDDEPVDYNDGALGFVLTDVTDCYLLVKKPVN